MLMRHRKSWKIPPVPLTLLSMNANYNFGAEGLKRFAEVLGQCTALAHLNFSYNNFCAARATLVCP